MYSAPPGRLRILVAADDPAIVGALAKALGDAGHEVVVAYRTDTTLRRSEDEQPDAVLLDLALPGGDAIHLIARLHARSDAPIIALALRPDEATVVAALEAGAIDVMTSMGRPLELVARIRVAVRRGVTPVAMGATLLDGLRVDASRREVWVDSLPVSLTPTEFELLAVIAARRGAVVDHRSLLRAGWPDPLDADLDTLRSHLGHLNQKLVAAGHPGLRNVRGSGYALRIAGGERLGEGGDRPR